MRYAIERKTTNTFTIQKLHKNAYMKMYSQSLGNNAITSFFIIQDDTLRGGQYRLHAQMHVRFFCLFLK